MQAQRLDIYTCALSLVFRVRVRVRVRVRTCASSLVFTLTTNPILVLT